MAYCGGSRCERWKLFPPASLVSVAGTSCSHPPAIKNLSFLRPLPTPPLYPVPVQAVCLPGSTFFQCFIADGVVFQNPTLRRPLWLRPIYTDSLVEGLAKQWPGAGLPQKHLGDCATAGVQRLWQITTYSSCQVSLYSGVFIPIKANMAALQGSLGPLPMGRLYGLYQMHSK